MEILYFANSIVVIALILITLRTKEETRALRKEVDAYLLSDAQFANSVKDCIQVYGGELERLSFLLNLYYYDFANHVHKTWFLQQDIHGRMSPAKYEWTVEEEMRLLNLKKNINEELSRRGYPLRTSQHLEGL